MSLILSLTTCINSPHISNIYKYTLPVLERTKLNSASESLGGGSGPNQPAHLVASPLVHCCTSPQASWREEQLDPATTINVESDFIVKCHFWSSVEMCSLTKRTCQSCCRIIDNSPSGQTKQAKTQKLQHLPHPSNPGVVCAGHWSPSAGKAPS